MTRLRLSPSASVTPAGDLVLLRSDLGTFAVRGADTRAFLDHIVPLLDGSRDAAEIAAALHPYSPRSVEAYASDLGKLCALEARQCHADCLIAEPVEFAAMRIRYGQKTFEILGILILKGCQGVSPIY